MATIDNIVAVMQGGVKNLANLVGAIQSVFPQQTGTSTSATAGVASALPATPAGYIIVTLPNGSTVKVPFYNQ